MGGRKYAARRHDATLHGHSHLTGRLAKFLSCFVGQGARAEARGGQPLTPDGQYGRYGYEGKQHLSHRTLPVRCYRTTDSNRVSASSILPLATCTATT